MTEIRDVTIAEMLAAMAKSPDHEVFRWFQESYVAPDGRIQPGIVMRLTVGQVRRELESQRDG